MSSVKQLSKFLSESSSLEGINWDRVSLPTVLDFGKLLNWAETTFGITRDEARRRYGQFDYQEWKSLVDENTNVSESSTKTSSAVSLRKALSEMNADEERNVVKALRDREFKIPVPLDPVKEVWLVKVLGGSGYSTDANFFSATDEYDAIDVAMQWYIDNGNVGEMVIFDDEEYGEDQLISGESGGGYFRSENFSLAPTGKTGEQFMELAREAGL